MLFPVATECGGRCVVQCLASGIREVVPLFLPQGLRSVPCAYRRAPKAKASCPCYDNWKTKRGGPKFP